MTRPPLQHTTARFAGAAAWVLFGGTQAAAQADAARPLWELGGAAVAVSQQAYPGADQQINRSLALPFFIYRGEVLRADDETAGLRAFRTPRFELDVGVSGSFGAGRDALEARRGMRKLGTLVELGPRLKWTLGTGPAGARWRAQFPLRAVFDLSDGAARRGLSFEPELVLDRESVGRWRYSASASAILADKALASTFYEVTASEATALRPAYSARRGLVAWRLTTSASVNLGPDWRVFGFVRLDSVSGAANQASPLVRQTVGGSVGLGLSYTWMRSRQRASD